MKLGQRILVLNAWNENRADQNSRAATRDGGEHVEV